MKEDDFYLRVARALSGCQLVEQQLKLYITEALELAKLCVGDKLPFKMRGDDYIDSSLPGLIGIFRKLSNNEKLIADLNRFKSERDFLSHKGISHCLDYDGDLDTSNALAFQDRLLAIEVEAQRIIVAIHEEANGFRAYLYFDDLEQPGNLPA